MDSIPTAEEPRGPSSADGVHKGTQSERCEREGYAHEVPAEWPVASSGDSRHRHLAGPRTQNASEQIVDDSGRPEPPGVLSQSVGGHVAAQAAHLVHTLSLDDSFIVCSAASEIHSAQQQKGVHNGEVAHNAKNEADGGHHVLRSVFMPWRSPHTPSMQHRASAPASVVDYSTDRDSDSDSHYNDKIDSDNGAAKHASLHLPKEPPAGVSLPDPSGGHECGLDNETMFVQVRRPETAEYDDTSLCVRVLTYNVNWGLCRMGMGTPRDHRIVKAIHDSGADIVCLQETQVGWQTFMQARLSSLYPYMTWHHHNIPDAKVNSIDGSHAGGLAILSRYPMKVIWCLQAPVVGSFFPSLLVEIDFGASCVIQLLNVHLRPPLSDGHKPSLRALFSTSGIRKAELQYYCERIRSDLPTIICGDFNEGHDGDALVWLKKGYGSNASSAASSMQSSVSGSVRGSGMSVGSDRSMREREREGSAPAAHEAHAVHSHSFDASVPHSNSDMAHTHDACMHGHVGPRKMSDALEEFDAASKTWSWPLKFGLCLRGTYDHILYSPDTLTAVTCCVLKEYEHMSDHIPVLADLRVRSTY